MTTIYDLQESILDTRGFRTLEDYFTFASTFLEILHADQEVAITPIFSPSHKNYKFYQFREIGNRLTRPLNTNLFIEDAATLTKEVGRSLSLLEEIAKKRGSANPGKGLKEVMEAHSLDKVVYTLQQSIGSVGDSFENSNQSRKRIGQLFECLVKLVIQKVGLVCEPRTLRLPIGDDSGAYIPYELDVVFSGRKAIVTSETKTILQHEVVGSIKTTSKDRIDKVFLDKYMLTKLLKRDIPVVAVFLHDVQRAKRGESIFAKRPETKFAINSTFLTNRFIGYSLALNRLDGVYYVDPRPEMLVNPVLRAQISTFQQFITKDLWILSSR